MKLEGLTINFLGDSITEGALASSPEKAYHGLLKTAASLKQIRNYGIGGTRYAYQTGTPAIPFDGDLDVKSFCHRYNDMEDADVVVVFGGTNDYGHGDAPLGTFADRTPDTFYGACHTLMAGLSVKYLGKPIVIMTPLHRKNELDPRGEKKDWNAAPLKAYVDIIREVAEYYSLPVLDLYAKSGLQPDLPEVQAAYCPDGLHPNDAGHAVIANLLHKFLLAL